MKPIPNTPRYLDAHAHLDMYRDGGKQALEDIETHGILTISTAMNPGSFRAILALAETSPLVIPAFGVHPWEAPGYADRLDELDADLITAPIIGEVGLDFRFVTDNTLYPAQERVFEYFLSHAEQTGKILNLHTPGAETEIVERLQAHNITRAIIHWYSGPMDALHTLIDIGCYFTVGVDVLFSEQIRDIARKIPLDLLLTETDNPGAVMWSQNTDDEGMPPLIIDVVDALSDIRHMPADDLAYRVMENFHTLTRDDLHLVDHRRRAFGDGIVPA